MSPSSQLRALALLCCLLTVSASGDDFYLVRLAIPITSLPPEELPLDDPNADFVEATNSVLLRQDGHCEVALYSTGTFALTTRYCTPLLTAHAASPCVPRAEMNTPLRC